MGADTAPVAVVITDTVPSPLLDTYACVPSGVIATPLGPLPTVMGGNRARRGRDHRHRASEGVGHVGVRAVGSDRYPIGAVADGDGG